MQEGLRQKKFELISVIIIILMSLSVFSAQINSTSYKQNVIVSMGGDSPNSSSYKTSFALGIINGIINSTSYINKLGFFHILLLANNQPCTTAAQCEGGFCCSSLCKSSACPSPGGGSSSGGGGGSSSGGGGGGAVNGSALISQEPKKIMEDFSISPSSVKEHLALGSARTRAIKIRNTGETALDLDLGVSTVNDFAFLSAASLALEPGEEKEIEINIIGKKLGSYFGSIEVSSKSAKKSADVVIEVESEQVLFDVKIDIPSAYKEIAPGEELKTQITLLNVGPSRKVDVTATYIIKDNLGNAVYQSTETFAVEKQTSYVKPFKIPKDVPPGDYIAIIELRYENSFAVSSELFKVAGKESALGKSTKQNSAIMFVFTLLVAFVFLFAYLLLPKADFIKRLRRKRKR